MARMRNVGFEHNRALGSSKRSFPGNEQICTIGILSFSKRDLKQPFSEVVLATDVFFFSQIVCDNIDYVMQTGRTHAHTEFSLCYVERSMISSSNGRQTVIPIGN